MKNLFTSLKVAKTKSGYTVITALLVAIVAIWAVADTLKAEVVVAADGDVQVVRTSSETVGELMEDLGYDITNKDELSHQSSDSIFDGMEIDFTKSKEVTVIVDGEEETFNTTEKTVGNFFEAEGIDFNKHDDISVSPISLVQDGDEIEITTAVPVKFTNGGEEAEKIWTTAKTVKDLLKAEDIDYNKKKDKIEPKLSSEIEEGTDISITYVETEEVEQEESIPFQVKYENDSSLEKGKEKVKTEGTEGKATKTYKVTFENDEEVSREVIAEETTKESKDKVVLVGTKAPQPKVQTTNTSSQPSGGKTFTMESTAYGPDCVGCSGISATGMNLKGGARVIAVDPSVIPLGSRVWVEGYGEAIAGDTGGAIKGNRIDVLLPSEAQAASDWGRRTVKVKILD